LTLKAADGWHVHWGVHLDVEFAMAVWSVSVSAVEFAFGVEIELPCGLGFEVDTTRFFTVAVAVAAPLGKITLSI